MKNTNLHADIHIPARSGGPVRGKLRQPTGPFFRRQRSFEIPTNDGKEERKSDSDTILFIFDSDSAIF